MPNSPEAQSSSSHAIVPKVSQQIFHLNNFFEQEKSFFEKYQSLIEEAIPLIAELLTKFGTSPWYSFSDKYKRRKELLTQLVEGGKFKLYYELSSLAKKNIYFIYSDTFIQFIDKPILVNKRKRKFSEKAVVKEKDTATLTQKWNELKTKLIAENKRPILLVKLHHNEWKLLIKNISQQYVEHDLIDQNLRDCFVDSVNLQSLTNEQNFILQRTLFHKYGGYQLNFNIVHEGNKLAKLTSLQQVYCGVSELQEPLKNVSNASSIKVAASYDEKLITTLKVFTQHERQFDLALFNKKLGVELHDIFVEHPNDPNVEKLKDYLNHQARGNGDVTAFLNNIRIAVGQFYPQQLSTIEEVIKKTAPEAKEEYVAIQKVHEILKSSLVSINESDTSRESEIGSANRRLSTTTTPTRRTVMMQKSPHMSNVNSNDLFAKSLLLTDVYNNRSIGIGYLKKFRSIKFHNRKTKWSKEARKLNIAISKVAFGYVKSACSPRDEALVAIGAMADKIMPRSKNKGSRLANTAASFYNEYTRTGDIKLKGRCFRNDFFNFKDDSQRKEYIARHCINEILQPFCDVQQKMSNSFWGFYPEQRVMCASLARIKRRLSSLDKSVKNRQLEVARLAAMVLGEDIFAQYKLLPEKDKLEFADRVKGVDLLDCLQSVINEEMFYLGKIRIEFQREPLKRVAQEVIEYLDQLHMAKEEAGEHKFNFSELREFMTSLAKNHAPRTNLQSRGEEKENIEKAKGRIVFSVEDDRKDTKKITSNKFSAKERKTVANSLLVNVLKICDYFNNKNELSLANKIVQQYNIPQYRAMKWKKEVADIAAEFANIYLCQEISLDFVKDKLKEKIDYLQKKWQDKDGKAFVQSLQYLYGSVVGAPATGVNLLNFLIKNKCATFDDYKAIYENLFPEKSVTLKDFRDLVGEKKISIFQLLQRIRGGESGIAECLSLAKELQAIPYLMKLVSHMTSQAGGLQVIVSGRLKTYSRTLPVVKQLSMVVDEKIFDIEVRMHVLSHLSEAFTLYKKEILNSNIRPFKHTKVVKLDKMEEFEKKLNDRYIGLVLASKYAYSLEPVADFVNFVKEMVTELEFDGANVNDALSKGKYCAALDLTKLYLGRISDKKDAGENKRVSLR